MSSIANQPDRN